MLHHAAAAAAACLPLLPQHWCLPFLPRAQVRSVKLRKDRIAVALEHKVCLALLRLQAAALCGPAPDIPPALNALVPCCSSLCYTGSSLQLCGPAPTARHRDAEQPGGPAGPQPLCRLSGAGLPRLARGPGGLLAAVVLVASGAALFEWLCWHSVLWPWFCATSLCTQAQCHASPTPLPLSSFSLLQPAPTPPQPTLCRCM